MSSQYELERSNKKFEFFAQIID